MTPLHIACEQGHVGAVAALLRHQPDVMKTTTLGKTAKMLAEVAGHIEIVRLIDEFSQANASGRHFGRYRLFAPPNLAAEHAAIATAHGYLMIGAQ